MLHRLRPLWTQGRREAQTLLLLCGWETCLLTSDLLLSSQIASVLIQSSAVAAALHSLVSLVQLLPQVYWNQGCFWFTDTSDIIGYQMNVCFKNHSAAVLLLLL